MPGPSEGQVHETVRVFALAGGVLACRFETRAQPAKLPIVGPLGPVPFPPGAVGPPRRCRRPGRANEQEQAREVREDVAECPVSDLSASVEQLGRF
jgi:hypothetical protein